MIYMTSKEKAYIGGIIDSKGSIMLLKFNNNELPSPCISISSTSIELLKWIKDVSKMGSIKNKENSNSEKHANSFIYTIKHNDTINLLLEIEPYLIVKSKKKKAKLILEKYKAVTPRNGRYSNEMLKAKEQFYEDFISIK